MKKTTFSLLSILFVMLLLVACRESGNTEQTTDEAVMDTVQTAAPATVDSLATELDQTAEEIEQQTNELKSALDSL